MTTRKAETEREHVPDLVEFVWHVPDEGYQWIELALLDDGKPTDRQLVLTTGRAMTASGLATQYSPLRTDPALFREFAQTEPSQDGILGFATRYGALGGDVQDIALIPTETPGTSHLGLGEPAWKWQKEILAMREAIWLWDLVHTGNDESLKSVIRWTEDVAVHYSNPSVDQLALRDDVKELLRYRLIATKDIDADIFRRFMPGDVIAPARRVVQRVINECLEKRVSTRVLWDEATNKLGVYVVPVSLIGALWLQFAESVAHKLDYRPCAQCGRWLYIHPDRNRTNKRYCSEPCRSKAYRRRMAGSA